MAYANRWNSTDQVAERAITSGLIGRFGTLDPTDGGNASRFSLSGRWSQSDKDSATRVTAYAINSSLNLWNNFTYYMDNTTDGDQFHQFDRRTVVGGQVSHMLKGDLAGKSMENEIGFQSRYDAIKVGLEDTVARQTTGVVRNDFVRKLASPAPSPVRLLPNLADAYRQKVADLAGALYSEETRAEAFEIVRGLIEKVFIHEGEDGKAQIELIGDIAAMVEVALGSEQQKTARGRAVYGDREKRSVKVVAGTGNPRQLSCAV